VIFLTGKTNLKKECGEGRPAKRKQKQQWVMNKRREIDVEGSRVLIQGHTVSNERSDSGMSNTASCWILVRCMGPSWACETRLDSRRVSPMTVADDDQADNQTSDFI
jgi:hypothetical protein